jgi:hypothetical protein
MREGGPFVFAQVQDQILHMFNHLFSETWPGTDNLCLHCMQVKHGLGVEDIVHILQAWEIATGNKCRWNNLVYFVLGWSCCAGINKPYVAFLINLALGIASHDMKEFGPRLFCRFYFYFLEHHVVEYLVQFYVCNHDETETCLRKLFRQSMFLHS